MKLRAGFIGLGAMGFSHLEAVRQGLSEQAEVTAICSTNEARIRQATAAVPGLRVFHDEDEFIESALDAIFVSTPNFTHVPLALKILQAGKHLFLEKPVGITLEECERLAEAAEATDRVLMIGHELRYSPYFQKIKQLIDAGDIGQPHLVWCREFRGPFQKKSRDWIEDARRSGGALVDKNCHHFDLMNWWAGSRPRQVSAFGRNAVNRVLEGENQVLDHATVSFEYKNGVIGTLQLCLFAPDLRGEDLEMGVMGDRGLLQTRLSKLQIWVWPRAPQNCEPVIHEIAAKRGAGWGGHLGFTEIHEAFVRSIQKGVPPLTTVRECLDGTRVAIAAEQSIRQRASVALL